MIQVQPFPPHDEEFAAHVRAAVGQADPRSATDVAIEAPSESCLRDALSTIRRRYPDVWIREQDPVARIDRTAPPTWYAFRDEVPGARAR
jgi:hypothetical protein